ncbi:hypothetical protein ONZ45_g12082 [Pleurotus djamor]|nr:hypothetical protein ONZ45_g12082 [Pleurotus djamor]
MVALKQVPLSILSLVGSLQSNAPQSHSEKSVLIVGAGSAGLAMLKALGDFPDTRDGKWDVSLFEQRRDVGGVWLPEVYPVLPPQIPETPLYPRLRTNTPVPFMTYPGVPFREGTPLYPHHEYIQDYHRQYVESNNLTSYIKFNHTVNAASWIGNSTIGRWNITYTDHLGDATYRLVDHLVLATGNNHYPNIPHWEGEQAWLHNAPPSGARRELFHSVWYRDPEKFVNRTVLVVGYRASGSDVLKQILPFSKQVYLSIRSPPTPDRPVIPKEVRVLPPISHFTADGIHFANGEVIHDIDSVILATGYETRVPLLEKGHTIVADPRIHSNATYTEGLATNLRYIFPLYQHIFSLCPTYPPTALAFIGLPIFTPNCASDAAQSLFAAHSIRNPDLLPSRETILRELALYEEDLRQHGENPYTVGHRQLNNTALEYMDTIIQHLKDRGALPQDGIKFVELWRRNLLNYTFLKRGWEHVEQLGDQEKWLRGVATEEEWADLMKRLDGWQQRWEERPHH